MGLAVKKKPGRGPEHSVKVALYGIDAVEIHFHGIVRRERWGVVASVMLVGLSGVAGLTVLLLAPATARSNLPSRLKSAATAFHEPAGCDWFTGLA